MRARAFILGGCAAFALTTAPAQAGPCTSEIESLTKTLASTDAGSGPTGGTTGSAMPSSTDTRAGQHPPTKTMSQAAQGTATSPEDVRRQTAGQPTAAQQADAGGTAGSSQHPPTAAMSQATQGQAAPMQPGQHAPTAAMTQATQGQMAPGQPAGAGSKREEVQGQIVAGTGQQAGAGNAMEASMALERARMLDREGKEADCMQAAQQARQLSGGR